MSSSKFDEVFDVNFIVPARRSQRTKGAENATKKGRVALLPQSCIISKMLKRRWSESMRGLACYMVMLKHEGLNNRHEGYQGENGCYSLDGGSRCKNRQGKRVEVCLDKLIR